MSTTWASHQFFFFSHREENLFRPIKLNLGVEWWQTWMFNVKILLKNVIILCACACDCVYNILMEEKVSSSTRNITKHTLIEMDACIQNSLPYSVAAHLPAPTQWYCKRYNMSTFILSFLLRVFFMYFFCAVVRWFCRWNYDFVKNEMENGKVFDDKIAQHFFSRCCHMKKIERFVLDAAVSSDFSKFNNRPLSLIKECQERKIKNEDEERLKPYATSSEIPENDVLDFRWT